MKRKSNSDRRIVIGSGLMAMMLLISSCSAGETVVTEISSETSAVTTETSAEITETDTDTSDYPEEEYDFIWLGDENRAFDERVKQKFNGISLFGYLNAYGYTDELNRELTDYVNEHYGTDYHHVPFSEVRYFGGYVGYGDIIYRYREYEIFYKSSLKGDDLINSRLCNKLLMSYLIKYEIPFGYRIPSENMMDLLGYDIGNAGSFDYLYEDDENGNDKRMLGNYDRDYAYDRKDILTVLLLYNDFIGQMAYSETIPVKDLFTTDPKYTEACIKARSIFNEHLKTCFGENGPQLGELITEEQYYAIFGEEPVAIPKTMSEYKALADEWNSLHSNGFDSLAYELSDVYGVISGGMFGNSGSSMDDTIYEWGNVSELLVWTSVMQLTEPWALIDLDEDIRVYLPDGFLHNLQYDEPVTMRDLMNHTAGWGEGELITEIDRSSQAMTLGDMLYKTEPYQTFRPGEVSSYSSWDAALAAYIIECVTGQTYVEYVRANIFDRLGMEHTAICTDHSDNAWVSERYQERTPYISNVSLWSPYGYSAKHVSLYPSCAAVGTVSDMALFAQSFVMEDHPLFKSGETINIFLSTSAYLGDTDIALCCNGFLPGVRKDAHLSGFDIATNSGCSGLFIDLEKGLSLVVMEKGGNADISEAFFGPEISPDLTGYNSSNAQVADISGIYLPVAAKKQGIYKLMNLFSSFTVTSNGQEGYKITGVGTIKPVSGSLYELDTGTNKLPAYVFRTENGETVITTGLQSYMTDKDISSKVILLAVLALMAVTGIILILCKLVLIIIRKYKKYSGAPVIVISQLFRAVSVMTPLLLVYEVYETDGLFDLRPYIFAGAAAVCMLVFAISFIVILTRLFSRKEKAWPKVRYGLSLLSNAVSIAIIVVAFDILDILPNVLQLL